jgi:glycosyltransferase involved in cell wall biosynthesis
VRIVHVSDCYLPRLGGIEQQVHDLALRQQARGDEVRIVTSVPGPDLLNDLPVSRPSNARSSERPLIRYDWTFRGRREVLAGDFDVVHAHVSAASPLAFFTAAAAARAGIPTALTVHSLWTNLTSVFRSVDLAVQLRRAPVAWSAVSDIAAGSVRQVLGPSLPVGIVPNGVDADEWRHTPLPRSPDRVTLATVGRLAARKRPRHLVSMLREIRARVPAQVALAAVIVGEGPQRRILQHSLDESGAGSWIHLAGKADHKQIRRIYESTDFYVAPATLESFGIAALEARCAGLPVVARRSSGIAEFITHDVEGLLVDDDEAMIDAMVRLATSPSTLDRLSRHNLSTAPAVTWPLVLSRCDDLYAQARSNQFPPSRTPKSGSSGR